MNQRKRTVYTSTPRILTVFRTRILPAGLHDFLLLLCQPLLLVACVFGRESPLNHLFPWSRRQCLVRATLK